MSKVPEAKADPSGGAKAGKPAQPVPGSTREPPPADPTDPDSPPAPTGVDAKIETVPVEMPKSKFDGGTNVIGISTTIPGASLTNKAS